MDEKTDRPENLNLRLTTLERKVVRALEYYFGTDASSIGRHGILDLGRSVGITIANVDEMLKEIHDLPKKRNAQKH